MSIVNGPIIFPKSEIASAIGVGRDSFVKNKNKPKSIARRFGFKIPFTKL